MRPRSGLTVLGSTGSIGQQTLAVLAEQTDLFVYALTAHSQVDRLISQCEAVVPEVAVVSDPSHYAALAEGLKVRGLKTEARAGREALRSVAEADEVSHVMAAIVGGSGLEPTYAAAAAGKTVLLANKESLVMSGELFLSSIERNGGEVIPVDSEHNAIFQCLGNSRAVGSTVAKLLLTGSGGPFLERPMDSFERITPAEACLHPNWSMGRKISVDSATMMNKGLELIEACFLFGVPSAKIDIVIHPQSVVHSMVAFEDGSVLAQMGQPDMRTPIASALAWPQRMTSGVAPIDFVSGLELSFRAPDHHRFPLLHLCRQIASEGQSAKVALNAANEVAVDAFLQERIRFTDIERVVKTTVDAMAIEELPSIEAVLSFDSRCRLEAQRQMTKCF